MTASAIYAGHVMHRRVRPRRHKLDYRLFMLLLDLDEIDALEHRLRLFSRNRRNVFSFRDADYGAGDATPLRTQVERHLKAADLAIEGGAIRLLTIPRILGFAFNPLSVYFCYRRKGDLAAILYEVNNTFGQRHSYLLPVQAADSLPIRQTAAKMFHVSPFMGMDMNYAFRVMPPAARLSIAITGANGDGPIITAALTATRHELSDATLLRTFATYPLLTCTIVAGIAWEAVKLWVKGVPVRRRPPPPDRPVTGPVSTARTSKCT